MSRKECSNILFICIIVGIPLYFLINFMTPILIIGIIILVIALMTARMDSKSQEKQLENIIHVEFIERTKIYKEGFEHTGFSIGTSGHGRAYFGKRKRLQGIQATFYVTYSDKEPQNISVKEGTTQYFKLMSYMRQQNMKESRVAHKKNDEVVIQPVKEEKNMAEIEPTVISDRIKLDPPKVLEIPFDVLPNEYSLEVRHQSCIYKQTDYNDVRYEVDIRCEVHYDASVKGITNRRIVVSLYDSKDRIFAVQNTWPDRLDKSGCKVVEINFWKDIYEEPSKVSISIERCP